MGMFFAQSLVRYLYNISPPTNSARRYLTCEWFSSPFSISLNVIKDYVWAAVTGHKSLHFIELCFPDQIRTYYETELYHTLDCFQDQVDDIRVTMVLLTGGAAQLNQFRDGITFQGRSKLVLLDMVIESNYDWGKKGELVIVNSFFILHRLLPPSPVGQLEKVLGLVRDVIKPHFMILSEYDHTNLSAASPFLDQHSFLYHSRFAEFVQDRFTQSNTRLQMKDMVFASHEEQFLTFPQWNQLLFSQGFATQSLTPPKGLNYKYKYLRGIRMEMAKRNDSSVLAHDNLPMFFTSIWKPTPTTSNLAPPTLHLQEIAPYLPSTSTTTSTTMIQLSPRYHPSYEYLNMTTALVEISDFVWLVCQKHNFPLALTWTPMDDVLTKTNANYEMKQELSIQHTACYTAEGEGSHFPNFWTLCCLRKFENLARDALQSDYHFLPSIGPNWLGLSSETAAVAMKIRMSYTGEKDYVVQFCVSREVGLYSKHPDELRKTLTRDMQQFCISLSVVGVIDFKDVEDSDIPSLTLPSTQTDRVAYKDLKEDVNEVLLPHQQVEETITNTQQLEICTDGGKRYVTCEQDDQAHKGCSKLAPSDDHIMVTVPAKRKRVKKKNENVKVAERKKRKNHSNVWDRFDKKIEPNGEVKATCKGCGKELDGNSKDGTTRLRNHIISKSCKSKSRNKESGSRDAAVSSHLIKKNSEFDLKKSSLDVPQTIEADILGSCGGGQDQMKNRFGKLHCRVSLSMTGWSDTKMSFCCLTSHFINEDWVLEKKIIGFKSVEYDNNVQVEFSVPDFTKKVLSEWSIDKNLLSMTTKNDFGNDELIIEIKRWVNDQKLLTVSEDVFHVYCFVHILNLMARDMLHEIHAVVVKIRLCITYVNGMKVELQGIEMPCLDVETMWDSTYLMLKSAVQRRGTFCHMNENDNNLQLNPSVEEWDKVEVICKYLQVFYVLLQSLGGRNLTANIFLPKVLETYVYLLNWEKSTCVYIKGTATRMKMTFDKYWRKCNLVLAVAVVLDPRYKFLLVEFLYNNIYGNDAITKIGEFRNALGRIYDEYSAQPRELSDSVASDNRTDIFSYNVMEAFCKYKDKVADISPKTELDVYLEEPTLDPEDVKFDILEWWHLNSSKYPSLGRMARDILAIPMSVSEPDSLFSINGKIIHPSITPKDNDIIEPQFRGKQDWSRPIPIDKQDSRSFIHGSSGSSVLPTVSQNVGKSTVQVVESECRSGVDPPGIEASKQCGAKEQPISRKFTDEEEWVWNWVQTVPNNDAVAIIRKNTIISSEDKFILASSTLWVSTTLMSYACSWLNLSLFKAEGKRWAFPSCIAEYVVLELDAVRNEGPQLFEWNPQGTKEYFHESSIGYDLAKCDMVFAPVLLLKHWFLICINISKKRLEVLNSLSRHYDQQDNAQHHDRFMKRMVQVINELINSSSSFSQGKALLAIGEWEVHNIDVPQQNNSNDCGVFVMNFMKLYNGDACEMKDAFVAAQYEMRKQLLVDMLLSPVNHIRPSFRTTRIEGKGIVTLI